MPIELRRGGADIISILGGAARAYGQKQVADLIIDQNQSAADAQAWTDVARQAGRGFSKGIDRGLALQDYGTRKGIDDKWAKKREDRRWAKITEQDEVNYTRELLREEKAIQEWNRRFDEAEGAKIAAEERAAARGETQRWDDLEDEKERLQLDFDLDMKQGKQRAILNRDSTIRNLGFGMVKSYHEENLKRIGSGKYRWAQGDAPKHADLMKRMEGFRIMWQVHEDEEAREPYLQTMHDLALMMPERIPEQGASEWVGSNTIEGTDQVLIRDKDGQPTRFEEIKRAPNPQQEFIDENVQEYLGIVRGAQEAALPKGEDGETKPPTPEQFAKNQVELINAERKVRQIMQNELELRQGVDNLSSGRYPATEIRTLKGIQDYLIGVDEIRRNNRAIRQIARAEPNADIPEETPVDLSQYNQARKDFRTIARKMPEVATWLQADAYAADLFKRREAAYIKCVTTHDCAEYSKVEYERFMYEGRPGDKAKGVKPFAKSHLKDVYDTFAPYLSPLVKESP